MVWVGEVYIGTAIISYHNKNEPNIGVGERTPGLQKSSIEHIRISMRFPMRKPLRSTPRANGASASRPCSNATGVSAESIRQTSDSKSACGVFKPPTVHLNGVSGYRERSAPLLKSGKVWGVATIWHPR